MLYMNTKKQGLKYQNLFGTKSRILNCQSIMLFCIIWEFNNSFRMLLLLLFTHHCTFGDSFTSYQRYRGTWWRGDWRWLRARRPQPRVHSGGGGGEEEKLWRNEPLGSWQHHTIHWPLTTFALQTTGANCSVFKYALTAAAVVDTYPPGSVVAGGSVWLTKTASQPAIFSHLSALSNCCPQTEAAPEAIVAHVFYSDAKIKKY